MGKLRARVLPPYDPEAAAMEAGRIALTRIRELIASRIGFTWETTLSGNAAVVWLRQAREAGYVLKTYFLWVRNPETTIRRIRQRVVEGGHDITEEVSRRRFFKTIQNFFTIYRPVMTSWKLYENESRGPRLLAVEKHGRLVVRDPAQFAQMQREAEIQL